jgi:hypothetical protein
MWKSGSQVFKNYPDHNKELAGLLGDLGDIEARITLTKFLRANLGFTIHHFCGVELTAQQEIVLKAMFIKDNFLFVAGRGTSKSFLISLFCLFYPIFYFNTKTCLISANFRSARRILENADKILNSRKSRLLKQCYPNGLRKGTDICKFEIPNPCGSEVFALPLSSSCGEGLRGTRANAVCVDEGLLITKDIQEFIIRPFLTAKLNFQEEKEISEREDELIAAGAIKESERISFPKNKYHVFSSASFKFEYLYEFYENSIKSTLLPPTNKDQPTYAVVKMSYEAVPPGSYLDLTQIQTAIDHGGENSESFKREYKAIFTDTGDGYFDSKRMHECTVKANDFPCVQLVGSKDSDYILAIDPSYSANKNSDYFAMSVFLLNREERKITLVHTYGKAGGELKDHFNYLTFILTHFNIVWLSIDASGTEFIHGYNESSDSKEKGLNLGLLDVEFDTDDLTEYRSNLGQLKRKYALTLKNIVYAQKFSTNSIRRMNEHLQNQISASKVWFASPLNANESMMTRYSGFNPPGQFKDKKDNIMALQDWIDDQDNWIRETKSQTALIEVKANSNGVLQYKLPGHLERSEAEGKARKDHYTCLMIATFGAKIYYDMLLSDEKPVSLSFTPMVIR